MSNLNNFEVFEPTVSGDPDSLGYLPDGGPDSQAETGPEKLSTDQVLVLRRISEGKSMADIAIELSLVDDSGPQEDQVEEIFRGVRTALSASNAPHAMRAGFNEYLADPDLLPAQVAGPELSKTEYDLLYLVSHGYNYPHIKEVYNLSVHRIKMHMMRVNSKFSVSNRTQSVLAALRAGILDPNERSVTLPKSKAEKPGDKSRQILEVIIGKQGVPLSYLDIALRINEGKVLTREELEKEAKTIRQTITGSEIIQVGLRLQGLALDRRRQIRDLGGVQPRSVAVIIPRLATDDPIDKVPAWQPDETFVLPDKKPNIGPEDESSGTASRIGGVALGSGTAGQKLEAKASAYQQYASTREKIPEHKLPDLEVALEKIRPRKKEEVFDNARLIKEVFDLMDRGRLTDFPTRSVIALRYGIYTPNTPSLSKQVKSIWRKGVHEDFLKIMARVPERRGITAKSASLILGFTERDILSIEKDFLSTYKEVPGYSGIQSILPLVEAQIEALEGRTKPKPRG